MKAQLTFGLALFALTSALRAEVLYTVEESTDTLSTIDTVTGIITPIGALGVPYSFGDLAFDASSGIMYMTDGWGQGLSVPSTLYTVNLQTGAATVVGSTGALSIFGLAIDPVTHKLYGSASTTSFGFYEINKTTGVATLIGNPGIGLDGLTYVGTSSQVIGCYAGPGSLHSLDLNTGAATLVTSGSGFVNNCGIAWGPQSNHVFAIDWSGVLYDFDVANGYSRTILYSGFGAYDGLAFVGSVCPSPTVYCTSSTSTHGCAAAMGTSGTPSLAAASGFTVSASNVEGQKSGIFFYGITGPQAQQWALGSTSFLCVKAPTQRTVAQNSGGTVNLCDGNFSLDWRAFMTANPIALGQPLAVGQQFNGQYWFRDPPAPKTTNLSNAVQWVLCP